MYLFLCKAISDHAIKKIIADNNVCSIKEVQKHCPVGAGCGMCIEKLRDLLRDKIEKVNPGSVREAKRGDAGDTKTSVF